MQRDYVEKLLQHYIAQWPVVLEEANSLCSPFLLGRDAATLWANPLRHELLDWLIERVEEDEKNGICFNLRHALLEMFDRGEWQTDAETIDKLDKMNGRDWAQICFDSMFKHWPKASLDTPMYPIAGGKMAYAEYQEHMWDEHHYYGALRRELCQFCINYLEKEDAKANI